MKKNRFLLIPITFLSITLISFVISLSCNNDKKSKADVDSSVQKRQSPPLGKQGIEGEQPSAAMVTEGDVAMAVPPVGTVRVILENKDTQVQTTRKKAVSYIQTDIVTLPYKPPTTNKPPTASAGADKIITLPTNNTSLTGSGTDSDGTIATYTWTKVSGGAATLVTPSSPTTGVTGLVQGSYTFRLTVKDNGGLTASDDVLVTVNPAATVNKPPVASAGADKTITLPTNTTTLTGSGTDSDGTIASYAWSKVTGGAATIASPAAATTAINGLVQGAYVFRLTVKDNGGSSASDDVNVTVNAAPATGYLSLPISGKIIATNGQVIENLQFKNMADIAIRVGNVSNVIIRNCFFNGSGAEAIELEGATNVTITNCLFARMTCGVYALSSNTIKVNNNQFVNTRMRTGGSRGQFVQFNGCGGAGNEVMNNQGENFPGESDPEDMISMFNSTGTSASPIKISGNMFRGGCPSNSGGGIIAGDNGGGWTIIENNTLFNPGQYGSAIAGGHDIKILNNKIYSKQTSCSNNPLYVWKQSDPACTNHTVTGNFVTWIDKNGAVNNGWNSGTCTNTTYNPNDNKPITEAEMGVPTHLITFVTPSELLTIRK